METQVYTFDFETDPFEAGRIPEPFCVGVYDGTTFHSHWGEAESVVNWILEFIEEAPEGAIFYAHNGGKFDFHFFKEHLEGDIKIIAARITKAMVNGKEIRDSYSLIPIPLGAYKKTDISYWKMEATHRNHFKGEIISYLKDDCVYLYTLITEFIKEFGIALTMAGAAMRELKKFTQVDRMTSQVQDEFFRNFFYGGRTQCFESGVQKGDFKCYDVNSMYPAVMKDFQHPASVDYTSYTGKHAYSILEHCDFAIIEATNNNALPCVVKDERGTRLDFTVKRGKFHATGHEIRAGLETGLIKIHKVIVAFKANRHVNFADFIEHYYSARMEAKARGDDLRVLFYKLIMNSSYGKFAQNPEHFKDWCLVDNQALPFPWLPQHEFDNGLIIYSRPTIKPHYIFRYNVMTAASITGAARAQLMRGLHKATRPVYCDTDGIICEHLDAELDEKKLGAWKYEGSGDTIAIAGKKMYALNKDGQSIKIASKGVRLTGKQIFEVAGGAEIVYENIAPTFNIAKETRFIKRRVKAT